GASWFVPALARFFDTGVVAATLLGSVYSLVFWGTSFGLFAAGAAMLSRRPATAGRRLLVAALWVASELLRGRAFGQPWGLLGYTQHAHVALVQIAAVTGGYGVSLLVPLRRAPAGDALPAIRARRPPPPPPVGAPPAGPAPTPWLPRGGAR